MMDLYATLGVPKDADKATVRKAYRSKAKKVHPDTGGSPEQFALVKLAADILGDDARRAHYDRTGQASAPEPDNEFSEIMKFVSTALDMALQKEAQNGSIDYITNKDMLERMRSEIREFKRTAATKEREMMHAIAINEKLLKRFHRKKKEPNFLEAMIVSRISGLKENIEKIKRDVQVADRALEFLDDYVFEFDKLSPEANRQAGFNILTSAIAGRF